MDSGSKKKFFYQILLKDRGKYGMMVSKNSRAEGQRVARLVKIGGNHMDERLQKQLDFILEIDKKKTFSVRPT